MGKDLEGFDSDLIELLSQHLSGGTQENHGTKISVTTAAVPAEIGTKHLSNKSIEHYLYTNLFGQRISIKFGMGVQHKML
jgi:hypothetical protein